jgi:hypothetical protein
MFVGFEELEGISWWGLDFRHITVIQNIFGKITNLQQK